MKSICRFCFAPLHIGVVVFLLLGAASAQKLTVDEVIARHLESIGSASARKNIKSQVATGVVQFTVLRKGTGGNGKIVVASEGDKSLLGMTFSIPSYPAETIISDGRNAKVAFAINNARSEFGDFVFRYKDIVSEGLFGGTLSSAWILADLPRRRARVELSGKKKITGRDTFVLSYLPRGGSDVEIYIYIDQQTFEHVRTEYKRIISAVMGPNPDASSQQREQRQTLIEDFSDFRKEGDLNLPHSYRAYVMFTGAAGTREYEYKAQFTEFFFNQKLDPDSFRIDTK